MNSIKYLNIQIWLCIIFVIFEIFVVNKLENQYFQLEWGVCVMMMNRQNGVFVYCKNGRNTGG